MDSASLGGTRAGYATQSKEKATGAMERTGARRPFRRSSWPMSCAIAFCTMSPPIRRRRLETKIIKTFQNQDYFPAGACRSPASGVLVNLKDAETVVFVSPLHERLSKLTFKKTQVLCC
jgi:hypothetical protein